MLFFRKSKWGGNITKAKQQSDQIPMDTQNAGEWWCMFEDQIFFCKYKMISLSSVNSDRQFLEIDLLNLF